MEQKKSATKTCTLYKYMPTKRVADVINKQRLHLSDGLRFNDPFELIELDSSGTEHRIEGLRILCLTNSYQNKLMWAHYADEHRGVCLAVDVPADLVYPLRYTGTRIKNSTDIDVALSSGKGKVKKNLIKDYTPLSRNKKIALLKDRCWLYEKEYRIVFEQDERGFIADGSDYYLPVNIKRIYIGVRFDDNDSSSINDIKTACSIHDVEIKTVEKSNSNYSIRIRSKGEDKL